MRTSRRSLLAAGATGTLALTAGCLDFALGNGPLEFDADRAAPTDEALAETGYEEDDVGQRTIEETVEAGVEREIRAVAWTSVYAKAFEVAGFSQEGAIFGVLSTPGIEVLGRSFNPLADMSSEELLVELLDQMDGEPGSVESIDHEGSTELEILGATRDVDVFSGVTELMGQEMDVEISLASFAYDDDFIVTLGSYPQQFDAESGNLETLMGSVEHPV